MKKQIAPNIYGEKGKIHIHFQAAFMNIKPYLSIFVMHLDFTKGLHAFHLLIYESHSFRKPSIRSSMHTVGLTHNTLCFGQLAEKPDRHSFSGVPMSTKA